MRVIRSSGQNVSPSDDGRLYQQAFEDGLFESTTINSLGGNLVSIGAMYGIMQGRDFTVEAQNINVELPSEDDTTGYIYVQFDTTTSDVITVESALAPFTPTYEDINTGGTICQMIIAEYTANAVAVTTINSSYPTATTKTNPTLVGSVAQIETSPATASHTVGQYLVYNGQLYKVTAAISVGETLVVGTNILATSVGDEISDLNSDISKHGVNASPINISSYTSANSYTCPTDGYIRVYANGDSIFGLNKAGNNSATLLISTGNMASVFVRKGTRVYSGGSGGSQRFIPLE